MKIQQIAISPSIARQFLEANTSNRRVKRPVVLRYASDMLLNKWKADTAEFIKVSRTGKILDGQHRLFAVIEANKTISFHVATGLADEIFDVLDTGSMRNASDVFKIDGVKNDNVIPAIISNWYLLKQGVTDTIGAQKNTRLTNAMLLETYHKEPERWQEIAKNSMKLYDAFFKTLAPSIIGAHYALFRELDADKNELFFEQLCTGFNISNRTVALLRNKLLEDKTSQKKISASLKTAFIIKAWNYFRIGKEVKYLKFNPESEPFPKAV